MKKARGREEVCGRMAREGVHRVLVMAGEEDPVCPLEDALEIVAALPKEWVSFARFPHVGHGAWRDDPQAAFAVLRAFIAGEPLPPLHLAQ